MNPFDAFVYWYVEDVTTVRGAFVRGFLLPVFVVVVTGYLVYDLVNDWK